MPMTNKEWLDIKLEEVRESGDNIGEDFLEALTRLEEEISDKDHISEELKNLKEIFSWAEKEICNITSLYKKFNKPIKPLS